MQKILANFCRLMIFLIFIVFLACILSFFAIFGGLNSIHAKRNNRATVMFNHLENVNTSPALSKKNIKKVAEQKIIIPDYVLPKSANGQAPLVTNISTNQPVVFLTIDDGAVKDVSEIKLLKDNNVKASLFLARSFISENTDFFKQITLGGSLIENHTLTHNLNLSKAPYTAQKAEICGQADYLQSIYGRRPVLYRPPGGSYNSDTLRAANDCGMKAVVTWIAKANGGSMQYQIGDKLRAGDIVLMHFRPEFKSDLQAFIDAKNKAGLEVVLLENWLDPPKFE